MESKATERIGDIWAFNPAQMGEEGLMATLVGREKIIHEACAWLRENKGSVPKQHRLYFGPRGCGKTTLLWAIYYTVLQESDLRKSFLPVIFAEDTATIPDERQFVRETREALKGEKRRIGIEELFDTHAWRSDIKSLADFSKKCGRPFLFFIDNLQMFVSAVLEGRGGKKSASRGTAFVLELLNRPEFLVIAASLKKEPTIKKRKQPAKKGEHPLHAIWGRFRSELLGGIESLGQATLLLRKRAEYDRETEVIDRLRQYTGRIRGMQMLSDGNPRYLVMLYKLLRRHAFEGIQTDFCNILDGMTAVLEVELERQVTPSQKPVLKVLVELDGRASAEDVASEYLLPGEKPDKALKKQIANTLSDLTHTDFVKGISKGKPQAYETSPPLFQLWYEMRYLLRSHRVILLRIFDVYFPIPEQELTTAYQSFIHDMSRQARLDASMIEEALMLAYLGRQHTDTLSDLMELTRLLSYQQGFDRNVSDQINRFEETMRRGGKLDSALQSKFLKAWTEFLQGHMEIAEADADALLAEPNIAKDQWSLKVRTLLLKAWIRTKSDDSDSALDLCGQARRDLDHLKGKDRDRLEGDTFREEGRAHEKMGNMENAMASYEKALALHEKAGARKEQIRDILRLGILAGNSGDHKRASDLFQKAVNLSEKEGDNLEIIDSLLGLELATSILGEYDRAIEVGERALALARELKNQETEASTLRGLAAALKLKGENRRAIEMGKMAATLSMETGDLTSVTVGLRIIADAFLDEAEYSSAIEYGLRAVSSAREIKDSREEALALRTLTRVYTLMSDYDDALENAKNLEVLAGEIGEEKWWEWARQRQFEAHVGLCREYTLGGRLTEAGDCLRNAAKVADALTSEEIIPLLNARLFIKLLSDGFHHETMELLPIIESWSVQALETYIQILKAVIETMTNPKATLITDLPPVERSLAYEIIRQAEGREALTHVQNLLREGKMKETLEALEKLIRERPDDVIVFRTAWQVAMEEKKWEFAERYAKEALEISAKDAKDLGNLGIALLKKGDTQSARKTLRAAIKGGTEDPFHYNALASLYEKEKHFGKAAEVFEAVLKLNLKNEDTIFFQINLSEFLVLSNRFEDAEKLLKEIAKKEVFPSRKTSNLFIAYLLALHQQKRHEAASFLQDFCQNLIDHGQEALSEFSFDNLIDHASKSMGKEITILNDWAEAAGGDLGITEFVRRYGAVEQRDRATSEGADEQALAFNRIASGRIKHLEDIRRASTRKNAIEAALDAFSARYEELSPENRAVCQRLVIEAFGETEMNVVRAAIRAAGELFWRLKPENRELALDLLLEKAEAAKAPTTVRDAALRVLGALYFHLDRPEKKRALSLLRAIAKKYNPKPLRDLMDRIDQAKEDKP